MFISASIYIQITVVQTTNDLCTSKQACFWPLFPWLFHFWSSISLYLALSQAVSLINGSPLILGIASSQCIGYWSLPSPMGCQRVQVALRKQQGTVINNTGPRVSSGPLSAGQMTPKLVTSALRLSFLICKVKITMASTAYGSCEV